VHTLSLNSKFCLLDELYLLISIIKLFKNLWLFNQLILIIIFSFLIFVLIFQVLLHYFINFIHFIHFHHFIFVTLATFFITNCSPQLILIICFKCSKSPM